MMKRHIAIRLLSLMAMLPWLFASCTDNLGESHQTVVVDDSNLVETHLSLGVAAMNTTSTSTRADDPDDQPVDDVDPEVLEGTDEERKIDNIWVFQFDATTQQLLITPRYYDLSGKNVIPTATDGVGVDVLLKPDKESIVYVVANTGDASWATVNNSPTLDAVKKLTLTNPNYYYINIGDTKEDLSLPMEGSSVSVTPKDAGVIDVTVTRMYAKVEITIGDVPETIVFTDVSVSQIPYYCQVGTLATDDLTQAATYPTNDDDLWRSYAFDPGEKEADGKYTGKMVIYIPENLQGRNGNGVNDEANKTQNAKTNALRVDFVANYINQFTGEELERGRNYTIYPGCNNYNDYNVKRNFIYRVKMNLYTDKYDQEIPSSNCFVVKPDQTLSFLPYYRTETGGGHDFKLYLDADGEDYKKINDSDNMLENVKIIWQTLDAIGDNSEGDRVWIDRLAEATDEFHRKIHVKTGKRGNALIAAYNNSGEIVWSWHIWVTENEPANVSSAVVYSTYAWNENGIQTNVRVPGYAIMPCNLGALAYEPDGGEAANNGGSYTNKVAPETHGMLYQWGRKDPFPPSTKTTSGSALDYTDAVTGEHYANDNTTVVGKTAGLETEDKELFHSIIMTDIARREIAYSIMNPTVFICGTYKANQGEDYVKDYKIAKDNYVNKGDWQEIHQETLWGGTNPVMDGSMKYLKLDMDKDPAGNDVHIFDNYGDEKSIFDPCPSGWRVPPGDLWLGFTQTGMNPKEGTYNIINTSTPEGESVAGMYMYMNGWQEGTRLFFPTQGCRVADGRIIRSASCGNYHNATTDATTSETGRDGQRVNILHIHNNAGLFRVFETTYYMYYVKSTAGPIRCVRDHK